jgi:hypothetical protein
LLRYSVDLGGTPRNLSLVPNRNALPVARPYSHQKLGRRNQSAVSSELFPSRRDPFPPVFVMDAAGL